MLQRKTDSKHIDSVETDKDLVVHDTDKSTKNNHIASLVSHGLIALVIRQLGVNGVLFFGNVFLSRWVAPEVYGLFAAVLAFQTTLIIFADCGLGPALIQRNYSPTQTEIAGLFTVQLALFSVFALLAWFFAPWLATITKLNGEGQLIIRSCSIILGITALRSIPALLLERDLRFGPIVMAEVVGTIVYQVILLTLIWLGFSVVSVVYALIARYTCDLLIIWYFNPWKPRLSLNLKPILPYLRFGLNMQGVRLMAYGKDQLPLLLLVPFFGASSAGVWGWSMTYIAIPIYLIRLVERIMFPAFARSQNDKQQLSKLVMTALWLNFAIGIPLLFMLVTFAPSIIRVIYGETWLVALPVVSMLALNIAGGFITPIFFNFLYGIGESAKALQMFALWVVLTFIFALPAMIFWKLPGMAAAFSIATLIMCFILFYTVSSRVVVNLKPVLFGTSLALITALMTKLLLSYTGLEWPVVFVIVGLVYAGVFLAKDWNIIYEVIQGRTINL